MTLEARALALCRRMGLVDVHVTRIDTQRGTREVRALAYVREPAEFWTGLSDSDVEAVALAIAWTMVGPANSDHGSNLAGDVAACLMTLLEDGSLTEQQELTMLACPAPSVRAAAILLLGK